MANKTPSDEWEITVFRTVMRAAIPIEDFGSRMAVQYAREMAEFLTSFGLRIVPAEGYDPDTIRLAIKYMDANDPPMDQ